MVFCTVSCVIAQVFEQRSVALVGIAFHSPNSTTRDGRVNGEFVMTSVYSKSKMKAFECSKCGACCRNVTNIPGLSELAMENGRCKHLMEDNTCEIYETRPLLCRVDESHALVAHIMSPEEWQDRNYKACLVLQEKYAIAPLATHEA